MADIIFPALRPSDREFKLPIYPVTANEYNGAVDYPRLRGSQAYDALLDLAYQNILDEQAAFFIDCYSRTLSGYLAVILPKETLSGVLDIRVRERIRSAGSLAWYFSDPPAVESVKPGISTVKVRLIALLSGSRINTRDASPPGGGWDGPPTNDGYPVFQLNAGSNLGGSTASGSAIGTTLSYSEVGPTVPTSTVLVTSTTTGSTSTVGTQGTGGSTGSTTPTI